MTKTVERYLAEAHATETALITTLQAHITMTPDGSYRQLLERHLAETRRHAATLERRLESLDAGSDPVAAAVGLVETLVGQVLALGKAPLDALRGGSREEKLLKNAKDECATEALEIATYDALEAVARAAGDDETVAIARRHRAEEERMLAALREEIPRLAAAMAGERAAAPATADANGRFTRDADPIPGYATLNAGQVIARLPRLTPDQLREVAELERAGRARSTVLARIEVLLEEANGTAARDLGGAGRSPR
jgi:ferritin-like metal-binding protein YciE